MDPDKGAVDGVASNTGPLLGTGILNAEDAAVVVQRLMLPSIFSGFDLRTLNTGNAGHWPLRDLAGPAWSTGCWSPRKPSMAVWGRSAVAQSHAVGQINR